MPGHRVLFLLVATSLLVVAAARSTDVGGVLGSVLTAALAVAVALGLVALARIAYLDGAAVRERTRRARELRRTL